MSASHPATRSRLPRRAIKPANMQAAPSARRTGIHTVSSAVSERGYKPRPGEARRIPRAKHPARASSILDIYCHQVYSRFRAYKRSSAERGKPGERFDVEGLWEEVKHLERAQPVAGCNEIREVTRKRRRMAAQVMNPFRPESCEQLESGEGYAGTRRVKYHEVGRGLRKAPQEVKHRLCHRSDI